MGDGPDHPAQRRLDHHLTLATRRAAADACRSIEHGVGSDRDDARPSTVDVFLRTNLITAQAVARHMTARGSGTILTMSTAASRLVFPGTIGYGTSGTVVEAVSERLAIELGPRGVRVVCLRPHGIADGPSHGSFAAGVFGSRAAAAGLGVERWLAEFAKDTTALGRFPTVAEIADTAVFLASDHARAITGAVVDMTSGGAVRTSAGFIARSLA